MMFWLLLLYIASAFSWAGEGDYWVVIGDLIADDKSESRTTHIEIQHVDYPDGPWGKIHECAYGPKKKMESCIHSHVAKLTRWKGRKLYMSCLDKKIQPIQIKNLGVYTWGWAVHLIGFIDVKVSPAGLCVVSKNPKKLNAGLQLKTVVQKTVQQKLHRHFHQTITKQLHKQEMQEEYGLPSISKIKQLQPKDIQLFPIKHRKAAYLGRVHIDFPRSAPFGGYEALFLMNKKGVVIKKLASGPLICKTEDTPKLWNCRRIHGIGDIDGDKQSDFLIDHLGSDGNHQGMGEIMLHLSSRKKAIQLTSWHGG